MATVVENTLCETCGVYAREGSLYCYNCGSPVTERQKKRAEDNTPSDTALVAPGSRPPLRSAAALRAQRRASSLHPVEVAWEPRQGFPSIFVAASVFLSLAALVLLLLALYLR